MCPDTTCTPKTSSITVLERSTGTAQTYVKQRESTSGVIRLHTGGNHSLLSNNTANNRQTNITEDGQYAQHLH